MLYAKGLSADILILVKLPRSRVSIDDIVIGEGLIKEAFGGGLFGPHEIRAIADIINTEEKNAFRK
jgi:hypothetical protein